MILETIIRGNLVQFMVTFAPDEPDSASVEINFLNAGNARENTKLALNEQSDGSWFAEWDSKDALPSRTYWSVRSINPPCADDGAFELQANLANLGTVSP